MNTGSRELWASRITGRERLVEMVQYFKATLGRFSLASEEFIILVLPLLFFRIFVSDSLQVHEYILVHGHVESVFISHFFYFI
jgi:hypothetical protein